MKRWSVTIFLISACLFVSCSIKADSVSPVETVREIFSSGEGKDLESRFLGKETQSNWKVEIVETQKIKAVNGLFFVDDLHGWLIGAFGTIYRTENAGKDWQKVDIHLPEKTAISQIFFSNENAGWMIVNKYNIPIFESESNQFWIMKTSNGGRTWNSTFTDKASVVGEMKFANENVGYVTGYKYSNPNQKPIKAEGLFLKTEDGGASWTDLSKPFNDFKSKEDRKIEIQYMNDIADNIYFFSPNHLRLTTHSRRVLESKDGGIIYFANPRTPNALSCRTLVV